ncbi:MAG: heavy-metal-associated domain-containing protein, partial [Bacteroidales bacterium]|nr:heavy-metal-associated domain-containing protein [Bacteroidales bacterium]
MKTLTLNIGGMHCASCAANIGIALKRDPAIESAEVNVTTEKAHIKYNENDIDQKTIEKIIVDTGYQVISDDGKMSDHK